MEVHESYGKLLLSESTCFLCGKETVDELTEEHVFPKWLQRQYQIRDKKLQLLNGTLLAYRQLVIPCCKRCNGTYLSKLENEIKSAVVSGFEAMEEISSYKLYLWSAKLFYGILRKEITLLLDQSDSSKGYIVNEQFLESFTNLHTFLQGIRGRHKFTGDVPFTVLICNLHDLHGEFDFRDSVSSMAVAIKMGEIGLIVTFEDGGLTHDTYGKYIEEVAGRKLHPVQFLEVFAKVSYQIGLRQRPVSYVTSYHKDGEMIAESILVNSDTHLEDWNWSEFSKLLQEIVSPFVSKGWRVSYVSPDMVSSWMVDAQGEILLLSEDQWLSPTNRPQGTT